MALVLTSPLRSLFSYRKELTLWFLTVNWTFLFLSSFNFRTFSTTLVGRPFHQRRRRFNFAIAFVCTIIYLITPTTIQFKRKLCATSLRNLLLINFSFGFSFRFFKYCQEPNVFEFFKTYCCFFKQLIYSIFSTTVWIFILRFSLLRI